MPRPVSPFLGLGSRAQGQADMVRVTVIRTVTVAAVGIRMRRADSSADHSICESWRRLSATVTLMMIVA